MTISLKTMGLAVAVLMALNTGYSLDWRAALPEVQHRRQAPRTLVFCQAQFSYPLNAQKRDFSYYERWVDWPLFISPELEGRSDGWGGWMNRGEYKFMKETAELYRMDGFGVFMASDKKAGTAQSSVWGLNDEVGGDFRLLPIWGAGFEDQTKSLEIVLGSKTAAKANGKYLILFYGGYPDEIIRKRGAQLRERYGDQFVFISSGVPFSATLHSRLRNGQLTQADITAMEEGIRASLRVGDGIYFGVTSWDGLVDLEAMEFCGRVVTKVMAEEEFKGKYMALYGRAEHSNSYLIGRGRPSDGTRTLRRFMEWAMSLNPDLINIPEWDEVNENTNMRPTVFNGLTRMRIMRYYLGKLRGDTQYALPGDDTRLPNLVLSARKGLTLGEKLKIELLNIPDSDANFTYQARLKLKNPAGKVVHVFSPATFEAGKMQDVVFELPSEMFAAESALLPALEVDYRGNLITREEGWAAILLHPISNYDYKYAQQPLRDLLYPVKSALTQAASAVDGQVTVSAFVQFPVPVNYLELLENGLCVYSHDESGAMVWRENVDYAVFDLSLTTVLPGRPLSVSGKISVEGARGKWKQMDSATGSAHLVSGAGLTFNGLLLTHYGTRALLAVARTNLATATLKVDIPPYCQKTWLLAELIKQRNYVFTGKDGFTLALNRQLRQAGHAMPLDDQELAFRIEVEPEQPDSVLQLQGIAPDGKIWRGNALPLAQTNSGKMTTITVYSDSQACPIELQVAAERVPVITYDFSPDRGTTLGTAAGRAFWASRGGYVLYSNRKGGNRTSIPALVGSPVVGSYPEQATNTVPELVLTNGEYVLHFDGVGNFVTLPQNVLPRRAGFEVDLEVYSELADDVPRLLIGATTYRGGHGAMRVFVRKGTLGGEFLTDRISTIRFESDLILPTNCWSRVKIAYDLQNVRFSVDGRESKAIACPGPGLSDTIAALGGYGKGSNYFKGSIRSLTIKYGDSDR